MQPEPARWVGDEHWRRRAVAAVRLYQLSNPEGWLAYLNEADQMADADAPIVDTWAENRS